MAVLTHLCRARAGVEPLGSARRLAPIGIAFLRNGTFEVVSDHFGSLSGCEGQALAGESPRLIYASDEAGAACYEAKRAGRNRAHGHAALKLVGGNSRP